MKSIVSVNLKPFFSKFSAHVFRFRASVFLLFFNFECHPYSFVALVEQVVLVTKGIVGLFRATLGLIKIEDFFISGFNIV